MHHDDDDDDGGGAGGSSSSGVMDVDGRVDGDGDNDYHRSRAAAQSAERTQSTEMAAESQLADSVASSNLSADGRLLPTALRAVSDPLASDLLTGPDGEDDDMDDGQSAVLPMPHATASGLSSSTVVMEPSPAIDNDSVIDGDLLNAVVESESLAGEFDDVGSDHGGHDLLLSPSSGSEGAAVDNDGVIDGDMWNAVVESESLAGEFDDVRSDHDGEDLLAAAEATEAVVDNDSVIDADMLHAVVESQSLARAFDDGSSDHDDDGLLAAAETTLFEGAVVDNDSVIDGDMLSAVVESESLVGAFDDVGNDRDGDVLPAAAGTRLSPAEGASGDNDSVINGDMLSAMVESESLAGAFDDVGGDHSFDGHVPGGHEVDGGQVPQQVAALTPIFSSVGDDGESDDELLLAVEEPEIGSQQMTHVIASTDQELST